MKKYFLLALLAGSAATPALAQDDLPFTGLRVEGTAGYDNLDGELDGVAYGGGAGFDFNLGNMVAGVEVEYLESSAGDEETEDGVKLRFDVGRDVYVGGRLGFRVGAGTLAYAKAGYTNVGVKVGVAEGATSLKLDGEADGWRLGAGLEQLFGPNAYGKVEYRYSRYGTLRFDSVAGVDPEDLEGDIDLDRHQVVASVGFRF